MFSQDNPSFPMGGPLMVKIVFVLGSLSGLSFPFLIFLLLVTKPCTPPYLKWMLGCCTSQCQVKSMSFCSFSINTLFAGFDAWMWTHVAGPATLLIGNIVLGMNTSFLAYLKALSRLVIFCNNLEKIIFGID